MKALFRKLVVLVLAIVVSSPLFAGFWEWSTPYQGPKKDVITLIITGNYKAPVLISQLFQAETRQPYLLLPLAGDDKFYFCPKNANAPAMAVPVAEFANFVKILNPKQVIILGDYRYVPQDYIDAIDPVIPKVVMSGDWHSVAKQLSVNMNLSRLYPRFETHYAEMEKNKTYKGKPGRTRIEKNDEVVVEKESGDADYVVDTEVTVPEAGADSGEEVNKTDLSETELIEPEVITVQ